MKKILGFVVAFLLIAPLVFAQTNEQLREYNKYNQILKQIEAPGFDVTEGATVIKQFEQHTGLKYKPPGLYSDPELIPDCSGLRDALAKAGIEDQVINRILNENGSPVYGWDNHVSSIKDYNTVSKIFNSVPMIQGKPYSHPATWVDRNQMSVNAAEELKRIHGMIKPGYKMIVDVYRPPPPTHEELEKLEKRQRDEREQACTDARKPGTPSITVIKACGYPLLREATPSALGDLMVSERWTYEDFTVDFIKNKVR